MLPQAVHNDQGTKDHDMKKDLTLQIENNYTVPIKLSED